MAAIVALVSCGDAGAIKQPPRRRVLLHGAGLFARQQIKKTQAHLTGALVPSSDERWNLMPTRHRVVLPAKPSARLTRRFLHRSFLDKE